MSPAVAGAASIASMVPGGQVLAGGLAVGDTIARAFSGPDKNPSREAEVERYAQAARAGNAAALRQLEFFAFEKRLGLAGDARPKARDGTASPPAARKAAREALKQLIANGRRLSDPRYYTELGVEPTGGAVTRFVSSIAGAAAQGASPVIRDELAGGVSDSLKRSLPWIALAAVIVGVVGVVAARAARSG